MSEQRSALTPEAVDARVAQIEAMRGDSESAHAEEDWLYRDVLRSIADGASRPRELAARALRTRDLDFERWYA